MSEESYLDDLDWKFFNVSSLIPDIFSWTYGMLGYRLIAPLDPDKFDNAASKAKEIGIRSLIALGIVAGAVSAGTYIGCAAIVLSLGSRLFRHAGFYFQKEGFTHRRGEAKEVDLKGEATVMIWSIEGYEWFRYDKGVIPWTSRIDRIVQAIEKEELDVLVLQGVHDMALVEALIKKLKGSCAHFYTHLGKESGTMVIAKCAVDRFTHTSFEEAEQGFETFEIKASPDAPLPCIRIIATQLDPGKEAASERMAQVAQIIDHLAEETVPMPTLFVGSLYLDRDGSEEGKFLSRYLYHSYRAKEPTFSEALANQWSPVYEVGEYPSDFISPVKRNLPDGRALPVIEKDFRLVDCHLVRGFDKERSTKTALSSHHGVVTTVKGPKMG